MKKIAFFMGKGGVGKSTISSAASYALSREGTPVLHVSLDPAHNLSDIYTVSLSNRKKNIIPNLDAIEIDINYWIKKYLKMSQDEIKRNYSYNVVLNLDSFFNVMKYSPGTEEYAVLWAIEHIYDTYHGEYETIIFDTPPTALTLRFLGMPTISLRWIHELSRLRQKILQKRQSILNVNPESHHLKGTTNKEEDPVSIKLGSMQQRLIKLYKLFTQDSYLSIVINNDRLSLAESLRIKDELKKLDIKINSICLNKSKGDEIPGEEIAAAFTALPIFSIPLLQEELHHKEDLERIGITDLKEHFSETK